MCQLMERCDGHEGSKGVWKGMITFQRCNSA